MNLETTSIRISQVRKTKLEEVKAVTLPQIIQQVRS